VPISTSLIIRELQTQTTTKRYLTPFVWLLSKKEENPKLGEDLKKLKNWSITGGNTQWCSLIQSTNKLNKTTT
jgi:hypothetical protein